MSIAPEILHPDFFDQPGLPVLTGDVGCEITDFDNFVEIHDAPKVGGLSVIVRSCMDTPEQLAALKDDLDYQDYQGEVQIIGVDCGNDPKTKDYLVNGFAHTVATVERGPNFMPESLRAGVERADYNTVVTLIGHTSLLTTKHLSEAAVVGAHPTLVGAYGVVLPAAGSSFAERKGAKLLGAGDRFNGGTQISGHKDTGLMAADCAVIDKDVFSTLYPYIQRYGAGGADGQLGKLIMNPPKEIAEIFKATHPEAGVAFLPLLSVHHTHGFSPVEAVRQVLAWMDMSEERPYSDRKMAWHPHRGL